MSEAEIKEARALIRPYAKRILTATTEIQEAMHNDRLCLRFPKALIVHLGGGKTKMFCSMAAVRAWVAQQQEVSGADD